MTKARELAELGKAVSVHDNRLDFDRAVVIPGLIDAAGTTTIADASITTAKIADDAVTTAKVDTNITVAGTLGVAGVVTANAGVVVDNITIDGTEIDLSSGSLTIDVAGDIILDADGGGVLFKDGGTEFARIFNSASDLILKSAISDQDMKFQGNDGGSAVNALILDMSDAGTAIFNSSIETLGQNTTHGASRMKFGQDSTAISQIRFYGADTSTAGILQFIGSSSNASAGGERMRITSAGNVGIGTASPDGTLHVHTNTAGSVTANVDFDDLVIENNTNMGMSFLSPNNTFQQIGFGDPDDNDIGKIVYQHTNNSMQFVVNAAERMRIHDNGSVGIGNTIANTFNAQARNLVVGTGSGTNGITIYSGNDSYANIFFADGNSGDDRTRGGINYNHINNSMNFRLNDAPKMYILSDGKVGIGLSSPGAQLGVSGPAALVNLSGGSTGSSALYVNSTSGHTGELIQVLRNGTTKMHMANDGKLGIGTSSPYATLHVDGPSTTTPSLTGGSSTSTILQCEDFEFAFGLDNASPYNLYLQGRTANTGASGAKNISLQPLGGNVGLGTRSPSQILHINSNTPHVRIVNTTNTSYSGGTSKISMDNAAVAAARGMISETLYTWSQTTADSWILVRTPQAYANSEAGGWAEFKLSWTGYHATNNTLMFWTAVFHNNHGRVFSWHKTAVTTLGNGTGSYGPYHYTPAVAFYRQTSAGGGYSTNDSWMRNLYIKVSGNAASSVCTQRALHIKGLSGGFDYEIAHAGTSTPAGGLTSV